MDGIVSDFGHGLMTTMILLAFFIGACSMAVGGIYILFIVHGKIAEKIKTIIGG